MSRNIEWECCVCYGIFDDEMDFDSCGGQMICKECQEEEDREEEDPTCPDCMGTGGHPDINCEVCKGKGLL